MLSQADAFGRLPILVGVTGHRDLAEYGRTDVKQTVTDILQAIKLDYHDVAPVTILSALAKGADQLVAEIALELELNVHAILPCRAEQLEVGDPAAHRAAERILANPRTVATTLTAFQDLEEALMKASNSDPLLVNELRYEQAGLLIARHSHILLALVHPDTLSELPTGGIPNPEADKIGGSRRIVDFWITGRLEKGVVGHSIFAPQGMLLRPVLAGPLLHVATPRDSEPPRSQLPDFSGRLSTIVPIHALAVQLSDGDILSEDVRSLQYAHSTPKEQKQQQLTPEERKHRFLVGFFGKSTHTLQLLSKTTTAPMGLWDRMAEHVESRLSLFFNPPHLAVLQRLTKFNQTIRKFDLDNPKAIESSLADIGGEANWPKPPTSPADSSAGEAIAHQRYLFAAADGVANTRHGSLKRHDKQILGAVPISVFFFEIFEEFAPEFWLLAMYLAVFVVAAFIYIRIRRKAMQDEYQDCRLVGEASRVQFFWSLAGLPNSVADEYQASELGEGSWLYAAVKGVALQGLVLAERSCQRERVVKYWLGGPLKSPIADVAVFAYRKWYPISAIRYRHGHTAAGKRRWLLFACGCAIALLTILLLAGRQFHLLQHSDMLDFTEKGLIVLIPTIPAVGAIFVLWRERRAYDVHAREYFRMALLVEEGLKLLDAHPNDPDLEYRVLQSVGREALREVTRWLIAHRSQPIFPVPG